MVSSVLVSCNIKQVSFFLLSICFLFCVKMIGEIILFLNTEMLYYFFAFKLPVKQLESDFSCTTCPENAA